MISTVLRYEVLRRDNYQCQTCGRKAPDVEMEVDHVRPVSLGGLDTPTNLQALCRDCNRGKSATPADAEMVEAVRDRHDEFVAARAQAADIIRRENVRIAPLLTAFDQYWGLFKVEGVPVPRSPQWELTLREFLVKGLTEDEMLALVDVASKTCKTAETMWGRFYYLCHDHVDLVNSVAQQIMERRSVTPRENPQYQA